LLICLVFCVVFYVLFVFVLWLAPDDAKIALTCKNIFIKGKRSISIWKKWIFRSGQSGSRSYFFRFQHAYI
jgi:hypothetical protein